MEWISMKDEVPEEDKMVLIWNPSQINLYVVASRLGNTDIFIDYDEYPYYPTYWKPLPEPPKED